MLSFENYQQDRVIVFQSLRQYDQDRRVRILQVKRRDQEERTQRTAAVKEWLAAAPSNQEDHERFCMTWRTSEAHGSWILKNEKISNWRKADTPVSSLLWLNGIPGAGQHQTNFLEMVYVLTALQARRFLRRSLLTIA